MPDDDEAAICRALGHVFYDVVPERYYTYCALTARIAIEVFRQFEVAANLVPCQLWHSASSGGHVIGFVGGAPKPGFWDGHVVCVTRTTLIDAAAGCLRRDFSLDVPSVAMAPRITLPSQMMARMNLDGDRRLGWLAAPYGFDTTPPLQPVDLIGGYAAKLVDELRQRLGNPSSVRRDAA